MTSPARVTSPPKTTERPVIDSGRARPTANLAPERAGRGEDVLYIGPGLGSGQSVLGGGAGRWLTADARGDIQTIAGERSLTAAGGECGIAAVVIVFLSCGVGCVHGVFSIYKRDALRA